MSRRFITPVLGALAMVVLSATAFAQPHAGPRVVEAKSFVKTIPLRDMQWQLPPIMQRIVGNQRFSQAYLAQLREKLVRGGYLEPAGSHRVIPLLHKVPALRAAPLVRDPVLQSAFPARQPKNFTVPIASFDGMGQSSGDPIGCVPPDTDAAVGQTYVLEIVNCGNGGGESTVAAFDKTGTRVAGPVALGSLWTSGVCATNGAGDGVVLYDQLAQRWILTQFAGTTVPTDECVAVSQTSDPTGSYYVYDFPVFPTQFADYPKISVWPDAYYASFNVFDASATTFVGEGFVAFDRSAMLAGDANAAMVVFQGNGNDLAYATLPADLDGMSVPPAGTPGIFVDYVSPFLWGSGVPYALEMWQMTVDWANPTNSTLTGPTQINVAPFNDGICAYATSCIPQPSPGEGLDALGDRLMFRLAYRNGVGSDGHQALVVNQTVGTGAAPSSVPAGIRWYELDAPAGATSAAAWSVAQQGTFMPADGGSRWMGSIAMDHSGNLALGYSDSSPSVNPEVEYTGRQADDPAGEMTQPETTLVAGGGVQESSDNRWGDYSSMVIDPTDDCTFWYAQEYYASSGSFNWSTRIGAFKFANCTQGQTGTLTGTVTDASSNAPIVGVTITIQPGDIITQTGNNGTYKVELPTGSYTVTATDFGYAPGSAAVTISNGATTTQDFALQPAPSATLSGRVTDGSGHGYGLYAEIKVTTPALGQVADLWTSPLTGSYSVNLPTSNDYTLDVTSVALKGYNPATATLTLSGNMTQNFALTVSNTCLTPGYKLAPGFSEDFNGSTFPPSGWSVTNGVTGGVYWQLNSAYPYNNGNYTGGTGTAADADSNVWGPTIASSFDTSLITPPIPVTSLPANPILTYKANYQEYSGNEALDLDISTDGGTTWTHVLHWNTSHGTLYGLPGENVAVDLSPYMPGSGNIELRWHYYNPTSDWDWYAQIDDVGIGKCQLVPGGLFYGQLTDANSSQGVVGATVADDQGDSTTTHENVADPNLPVGVYLLFSPSGNRTLTASDRGYTNATATATMTDNAVLMQNFALKAGHLTTNPDHFTMHLMVNNAATSSFALSNIGDGDATFDILPIYAPPPPTAAGVGVGAAPHTIKGHFSPLSAMSQNKKGASRKLTPRGPGLLAAPWTDIADYPEPIMDNCAATDALGDVYSFEGYNGGSGNAGVYEYDPIASMWTQKSSSPTAVEAPACAYVNGRFYLADGWDPSTDASTAALQIYDPTADSWTTGADNPVPLGGGATAVALGGKMYVIGGCQSPTCGSTTVEVYDTVTNSWSAAANYPHTISWESCGAINGKIYCAGGADQNTEYADGYVYDPAANTWSLIASIPVASGGLWASGYITAMSHLLVSGGVTANFTKITNEGYSYDPGSNSWSALPNSHDVLYRGGSACGFYRIGGDSGNYDPVPSSELLPGYTPCGPSPSIPWLTVAPLTGTVASGASKSVALSFDGTGQTAFTTSRAYLAVTNNTPYGAPIVPLTVTWDPQYIHLVITGTASPSPVQKGGKLTYSMTVENQQMTNHGAATNTTMTYQVPAGATYVTSSGDASCTESSGTLTCDFGTVDLGVSKNETIVVQVANAGTLTSTFNVSAKEPDSDPSTNTVSINTSVTGTSDLVASSQNGTMALNATGIINMQAVNEGPDTATDVAFNVSSSEGVKLLSGQWEMSSSGVVITGTCSPVSGSNALNCDIGDVPSGQTVSFTIEGFGAYAGTATVLGHVTTSAYDPNPNNSVTTASITVKSGGGGGGGGSGGGALGWLALAGLLGLALAGAWARSRRGG